MLHHLTVCYSCGLEQPAVLSLVTPSFLMTPLTTPNECELYSQSLEEHIHSNETKPVSQINNSQSLSIDLSPPHLDLTIFEKSSSPEESSSNNGNLKIDISYPESLNQPINLPMGPSKSSNSTTSLYETSNAEKPSPLVSLRYYRFYNYNILDP